MMNSIKSFFPRILALACLLFLGLGPPVLPVESHTLRKKDSVMINLKAVNLLHAIQIVEWKPKNFPTQIECAKCIIVGEDMHNFNHRLSYLIEQSGTKVAGKQVKVESVQKLDDALNMANEDPSVLIVFVLDSVADQWKKEDYPKRPGLLIVGESEKFRYRGLPMTLVREGNRLRIILNLKKMQSLELVVSKESLLYKNFRSNETEHQ